MRDQNGRKLAWRTCPACGKLALVLATSVHGYCSPSCAKAGQNNPWFGASGEGTAHWKGDAAGYQGMHTRVRKLRGKPDHCERCGSAEPGKRYEWASLTHNYADPYDYEQMCVTCHRNYDAASYPVGEAHHQAKLTDKIVRQCRARYAAGDGNTVTLAREFGVTNAAMYNAIKGKTWKHVA
jgi:hypothetical protein